MRAWARARSPRPFSLLRVKRAEARASRRWCGAVPVARAHSVISFSRLATITSHAFFLTGCTHGGGPGRFERVAEAAGCPWPASYALGIRPVRASRRRPWSMPTTARANREAGDAEAGAAASGKSTRATVSHPKASAPHAAPLAAHGASAAASWWAEAPHSRGSGLNASAISSSQNRMWLQHRPQCTTRRTADGSRTAQIEIRLRLEFRPRTYGLRSTLRPNQEYRPPRPNSTSSMRRCWYAKLPPRQI